MVLLLCFRELALTSCSLFEVRCCVDNLPPSLHALSFFLFLHVCVSINISRLYGRLSFDWSCMNAYRATPPLSFMFLKKRRQKIFLSFWKPLWNSLKLSLLHCNTVEFPTILEQKLIFTPILSYKLTFYDIKITVLPVSAKSAIPLPPHLLHAMRARTPKESCAPCATACTATPHASTT